MNIEKIKNLDKAIIEAKLLMAEPFMLDPHFKRAVIVLCEHSAETGTVGFILNKSLKMKLNDLLASFPESDLDVLYGGPVGTDTLHYIHNVGDLLPESIKIANGLYWGGDFEELQRLFSLNVIKPENVRFFLGYSGWTAGQLQEEMRNHSWLLGNIDANYIFNAKPDDTLWEEVLQNEGGTFSVIGQISDEMNWN